MAQRQQTLKLPTITAMTPDKTYVIMKRHLGIAKAAVIMKRHLGIAKAAAG